MRDLSRRLSATTEIIPPRPGDHSLRKKPARAHAIETTARPQEKELREERAMAPPPKLSASNSSSSLADHFPNLRQFFQRSASQPSQCHDSHASTHSSSSSSTSGVPASPPRRASAAPSFSSSASSSVDPDAAIRMHAFGSCTQVLATAITALFRAINTFGVYQPESAVPDNMTTRRAKLLYVQLLDKAQRERGEWRGFTDSSSSSNRNAADTTQKKSSESALSILSTHLRDLPRDKTFALLNELVDVSFRSIRGPLVSSEIYSKHKRPLTALSLDIPVSLQVLLEIRGILNQLGRDEKLCVFRLLTLWHAMAVANEAQDLRRTIQEKHHLVFSDCSELEFLTTRKDPRHDAVAIALLHVLVLYHDVLFSDVEFLLIKQELQLSQSLRRPRVEAADAEETDESKANAPSEDSTQTKSSLLSPSQEEQTETESECSNEGTKGGGAPDVAKEQSASAQGSTAEEEAAEDLDESKVEVPSEVTAQPSEVTAQTSAPPSALDIDDQIGHDGAVDATTNSAERAEDEAASNSLNLEELSSSATANQTIDAEPTQSEKRSAGFEQETKAANTASAVAAIETVSEERSPQPKSEEMLLGAPLQSIARVSPITLTRSQSANPPHHHHVHDLARGHDPVTSIQPHSLSPRTTRQSKRFQFESLTVSTATTITTATNKKEQKQYSYSHHHNNSSSNKSNDARQAALLSDVDQIVDYFGASSNKPVARNDGNDSTNSESPTATAAIVRIQQHSPEAKESSNAWSTERLSSSNAAGAALAIKSDNNQESHAEAEKRKTKRSTSDSASSQGFPAKRASITKPPSPRPHEITDLANTYFSFSFAAATMRTMAIMAVYAIRRHQHNHQQQHE